MNVSRRHLLGLLGGAGVAGAIGLTIPAMGRTDQTGKLLRSRLRLPAPFQVPLTVPPVLTRDHHPAHGDVD